MEPWLDSRAAGGSETEHGPGERIISRGSETRAETSQKCYSPFEIAVPQPLEPIRSTRSHGEEGRAPSRPGKSLGGQRG